MSQTKAQLISDLVQALNFTGTASAPTNGAFLSAANTLAFATNSAQRLTINSSGNVGIGTTSPSQLLHLKKTGANALLFVERDSGALGFLEAQASKVTLGSSNNHPVHIVQNSGDALMIDSSKNVGIGTTSPAVKLHLSGTSGLYTRFQNTSAGNNVNFGQSAGDGIIDVGGSFGLRILTNSNDRIKVDSSGNVGIGTTSPGKPLDVVGEMRANAFIGRSNISAPSEDTSVYRAADNTLAFGTASTERMRINGSGNVGIGTSSPTTKFHVLDTSKTSTTARDNTIARFLSNASNADCNIQLSNGVDHSALLGIVGNGAEFYIAQDGNERLRIDSSGNVGIGISSPARGPIHSHTSGSTNNFHLTNANSGTGTQDGLTLFVDSTSSAGVWYREAGSLRFATNNSEKVRIDSSGNVGIGTTSPQRRLHQHVSSSGQNYHSFTNDTTGSSSSDGIILGINVNEEAIFWNYENTDMRFATNGTDRLIIDNAGKVGIGTTSPSSLLELSGGGNTILTVNTGNNSGDNSQIAFGDSADADVGFINYDHGTNAMQFRVNASEALRITNGGDLVLNSDTARVYNGHTPRLSIQGTNFSQSTLAITSNSNGTDGAYLFFVKQRSGSVGGSTAPSNGDLVGQFRYLAGDGTDTQSEVANISVNIDGAPGSNDTPGRITFATTNDGGNASTERMRITSGGHVHIGSGHGNANHRINGNGFTQGQTFLVVSAYSSSAQDTAIFFGVDSGGGNTASCGLKLGRNSSNLRSLNAGGTVNASGTDYAEYMTKSSDFTLAKGAICGINAEGKLTNKFSESISFVVKSTDPSYVGGDTWGSEDILGKKPKDKSSELPAYEEKMEAARKMVDRIAFSGQVPVNVTGTTPGQHIIPTLGTDDSITGVAKAEASLSMAEYISSVGKVIALESDGRARIIVKVA